MTERRTRQEGKEFYADTWAKASMDCKQTLLDLQAWFPNHEITVRPGYHALSVNMEEYTEHDSGEPDIFVRWQGCIVCAVEVTGSDKVSMPVDVWIPKTKMEYAAAARFPVAYALYYRGSRHFVPADKVRQHAAKPETKTIGGYAEYYHVLDPCHVSKFQDLQEWIRHQIIGHVLYKGGGRIYQVDGMPNSFAGDPSPF